MAVVGEAHIMVRAITSGVKKDIEKGFNGIDGSSSRAGKSSGAKFASAFKGTQGGVFDKLKAGMNSVSKEARAASKSWQSLQKRGFALQSIAGVLAGSVGSLVGALGSVAGIAGAAGISVVALAGTFVSLKLASIAAKFALSGIGAAVSALNKQQGKSDKANKASARQVRDARRALAKVIEENAENLVEANKRIEKAQLDLNKAFREGQEEVQQLGFDAEDAAINEKKAALELERARETLLRVQDLPPNSRARREAELAFQEAELNYRRAIDQNSDLAAEQQRIAGDPKNTEGYISAAEEVADAEADKTKTVRDGIRSEIEARERLTDAIKDSKDAASSAAADPLAGLTASQKDFAKYLASLKPMLDGLKESIAKGFLPELQTQLERIISSDLMGVIEKGAEDMGVALGKAAKNFTDEILKPENIASIAQVLDTAVVVTEKFGSIAGKAFGIVVTILDAADPLIRRFVDFIETKLGIFDDFLKTKNASGELTTFFNQVGDLVGALGPVFSNIFSGLSALIKDAVTPGSGAYMLIDWLKSATKGFADLGKDPGGLRDFLQSTASNTISMFSSIGSLFKEIMGIADMPEIKIFWDTLKEGAPYVGEILRNGILAAPSLANLVVNITRIVAAFADSGAPKAFFDTLSGAAGFLADILSNKVVKGFLDAVGPLVGVALAVGTMFNLLGKISLVLIGTFGPKSALGMFLSYVGTAMKPLITFFRAMVAFGGPITQIFGKAALFLTGPWGIAIAAAIAALVYFFTQTEIGKEIWANFTKFLGEAWQNIITFFGDAIRLFVTAFQVMWEGILAFFKPVIDTIVAVFTTAFDIIRAVFEIFKAIFLIAFVLIGTGVQAVWDGIKAGFKVVADFLKPIVEGIQKFFEPIFKAIGKFVGDVWKGIQDGFKAFVDFIRPAIEGIFGFFSTVFTNIGNFFKGIINLYIGFAEGFVNFFIRGLNWIIERINTIKLAIPELLRPFFGGQSELGFNISKVSEIKLPRLADGGVVRATAGGMLAQIGEGGRDERVEPLDANGLSARDKAMIELLAGRNGAQNSVQIIVNPAPGMNERELAQAVSKQLAIQMRKGSIA